MKVIKKEWLGRCCIGDCTAHAEAGIIMPKQDNPLVCEVIPMCSPHTKDFWATVIKNEKSEKPADLFGGVLAPERRPK